MKRILSVLFIAALLVTCVITTAFAVDDPTITVSKEVAKVGEKVTVEVKLTGNTGFMAYGMELVYDSNALELVIQEDGYFAVAGDLSSSGLFIAEPKTGIATFAGMKKISADGVLFTVDFTVKEGAAEGEYPVSIKLDSIGLSNDNEMAATVVNGSVTVPHTCAPVAQNGTPATCTANGVKAHSKCACGKLYIDGAEVTAEDLVISATGHAWEWVVDKEATEDETGLKHEECSVCKEKRNENTVIPVLAHDCTDRVKVPEVPATCDKDGVKEHYKCEKYGTLYDAEGKEVTAEDLVIPATGHAWEWVVDKAATEDETGLKHEECSVCKEKRSENTVIPALNHSCTDRVKVPEVPATCEKDGVKEHYKCEKYGTLYDAEGKEITAKELVIPATGHTYTSVVTKPTCTEDGYTTHTCACGDSYVDTTVKASGHDWNWVVDKAATEDETGLKHEECSVCKEKRNENTVIPALNHSCTDRVKVPEVPATCEKDGVKEHYKCEKYGTLYDAEGKEVTAKDLVIPATGHTYTSVVTKPTCTEEGYTTHTCACGDSYVDTTVKATGHTEKLTGKAEADCEADGYTGDKVCADCGEVLEKGKVIPAIGHDYDKEGYCKNCGHFDPDTGDNNSLFVWVLAMAACAGAVYVTLRKRNNA